MLSSPNDTIRVETKDGVATVTLNRPAALNALDRDMVAAFDQVTAQLAAADDVRAVVIAGAGDHFMAGGDLKMFKDIVDATPDKAKLEADIEGFIHLIHPSVVRLRQMPKPVIASARGAVAGFGVSLLLACDLAIVAEDAYFTLAYCHIGTSPDGGSTYALPRVVGLKRALEIALLGDRFDAAAAREFGMVNWVVPGDALAGETAKLAGRLAKGPTRAYANSKALLNESLGRNLEEQLDAEAKSFADCASGGDFAEGITAFTEKRKPDFKGT